MLASSTKDIEAANGDEALRSRCLGPLEKLRSQVDRQESIAHITQTEHQALHLFDTVQEPIAEYATKTSQDTVVVKKVRPVTPASLVTTTYLESKEEVDGFLDALKQELYEAIKNKERIQIR